MRSQPAHIEIIGEKNTVASIIRPVASRYTIPFTIGCGYCSLLPRVEVVKVALTAEHVEQFGLRPQLTAKAGSSRRTGFVAANGEDVFELEAIRPTDLQHLLDESIRGVIDIARFNEEARAEKYDAARIASLRKRICDQASRANWDFGGAVSSWTRWSGSGAAAPDPHAA